MARIEYRTPSDLDFPLRQLGNNFKTGLAGPREGPRTKDRGGSQQVLEGTCENLKSLEGRSVSQALRLGLAVAVIERQPPSTCKTCFEIVAQLPQREIEI